MVVESDRIGAFLFRQRLAVMMTAFALALSSALAGYFYGPEGSLFFAPVAALIGEPIEGTALVLSGLGSVLAFLLRTAAEARLREDVYGQGGSRRLVLEGPFEWVRNPLYVGTFLFIASAEILWAPAGVWVVLSAAFFIVLDRMVRYEERLLLAQFGAPYREYLERVSRWIPRRPARPRRVERPSLASYGFAALGNLGLLSLGLYRWAVALDGPSPLAGRLQAAALTTWLLVLGYRRFRGSGVTARSWLRSSSP